MQIYSLSTKGSRNPQNEDAYLCSPKHGLFLVADGMGGHAGSAFASQHLVRSFLRLQHSQETLNVSTIEQTIQQANQFIYNQSRSEKGIGTTLSLIWFNQEEYRIFHVGDSRIYRLRDFKLNQLTTDHVARSNELGDFQEAHVKTRGINRAIGIKPQVKIDQYHYELEKSDIFVLTTDGISDVIPDYQLLNILTESENIEASTVQILTDIATKQHGTDDKTLILINT